MESRGFFFFSFSAAVVSGAQGYRQPAHQVDLSTALLGVNRVHLESHCPTDCMINHQLLYNINQQPGRLKLQSQAIIMQAASLTPDTASGRNSLSPTITSHSSH